MLILFIRALKRWPAVQARQNSAEGAGNQTTLIKTGSQTKYLVCIWENVFNRHVFLSLVRGTILVRINFFHLLVDRLRPRLMTAGDAGSTDYINASFLNVSHGIL